MSPHDLVLLAASATAKSAAPKPAWIENLDAIGRFVDNAGWPVAAFLALILLRKPLSERLSVEWKDWSIKIGAALNEVAKDATGETAPPTKAEFAKSGEIERLAAKVDPEQIRKAAIDLGVEYESVRSSMSPGHDRTRRMEVVVSKMRALGRAVVPFRYDLRASPSPGRRLAAIASYQVAPDYDSLEWLVDRLGKEKPFVGYHAAVALLTAAQDGLAKDNLDQLQEAVQLVAALNLPPDSDRNTTLQQFTARVQALAKPSKAQSAASSQE